MLSSRDIIPNSNILTYSLAMHSIKSTADNDHMKSLSNLPSLEFDFEGPSFIPDDSEGPVLIYIDLHKLNTELIKALDLLEHSCKSSFS